MHKSGVCHRDVKPSNILVTDDNHVYLIDFNVAIESSSKEFKMMTKTGTLAFTAPEVFEHLCYNEKVDMWSAGIVLFVMLSGDFPFFSESVPALIAMIKEGVY